MVSTNESSLELLLPDSQAIPLAIWTTVVTLSGILGNAFVIYSSICYNAIEMDRISLFLIQNLAVADFLYTVGNILPSAVSYIVGRYVLGNVYCFISAQTTLIFGQANPLLVLAITAYRLHLLRSPLGGITRGTAKIGVAVIWVTASSTTITSIAYRSESIFSQKSAKCWSSIYSNESASILLRMLIGGILIIPLISIIIMNFFLFTIAFKYSRKFVASTERSNSRALTTVCALSGTFIVSYIPFLIFLMWKGVNPDLPFAVEQLGISCIMINACFNPILYTMTNRRFGKFVWKMFISLAPGIGSDKSSSDPSQSATLPVPSGRQLIKM